MKCNHNFSFILLFMLMALLTACGSGSGSGFATPAETQSATATPVGESDAGLSAPKAEQIQASPEVEPNADIDTSFVEEISLPASKLTDGPIFFAGDKDSFTLTLYSLKTGKKTDIIRFDSQKKYSLAIDPTDTGNYFHRQLFDSNVERIAVSWYEPTDSSCHVGWIDKTGTLTDVTNRVHPVASGFSRISPNDSWPLFCSDDRFVFYDANEKVYCYYDENTNSIVEKYDYEKSEHQELKVVSKNLLGLNFQDRPSGNKMICDGAIFHLYNYLAGDETIGKARDYVVYPDGYTFFEVVGGQKPAISHYGPGITEIVSPGSYTGKKEPFYNSERQIVKITPETEYRIENLAYFNGTIVFTASRGTERFLFKMSYVDRVASEPELITNIDTSWGDIFFWSNKDTPVYGLKDEKHTIQRTYTDYSNFSIEGKWKNIGEFTFGQVQPNSTIIFDGANCNFISPSDTYSLSKDGRYYRLDCTSLLGDTLSFTVKTIDKDTIDIYNGDNYLELKREQ